MLQIGRVVSEDTGFCVATAVCLAAEAVQRAALALERVHDVERRDRLAARVLRVRDGVTDDVLEEDLEDAARLLVDEAADALDTTAASEAADGGLLQSSAAESEGDTQDNVRRKAGGQRETSVGPVQRQRTRVACTKAMLYGDGSSQHSHASHRDALDVVAQDLAVTLRTALAQTLAALATTRHFLVVRKCARKE